ncbi:MAG: hypothetical protein JW750_08905 [Anaerolineaceae bacterium]|nr:hypothetical protein [Anaerolineaceae bacterium]
MKKNLIYIAAIGLALLALAASGIGNVLAEEPTPTEEPEVESEETTRSFLPFRWMGRMQRAPWGQTESYLDAIADEIGVDVDTLRGELNNGNSIFSYLRDAGYGDEEIETILEKAHDAVLDEAVAEGLISEEQAQLARERMEQMESWRENQAAYRELWLSEIAAALEMGVDDLYAALEDGGHVHDLLEEKFGEEASDTLLLETRDKVIAQALEDGLITEEQAERIQNMPGFGLFNGIRERFQDWNDGGMFGGRGGRMGRGGRVPFDNDCPGWDNDGAPTQDDTRLPMGGWGRGARDS